MNKKQQIEGIFCAIGDCDSYCKDCETIKCGLCSKRAIVDAEAIYNAGYRKIPEDNIRETVEKPVDTQKREYKNIDDIARGFVVKDGKLMYVTNILDGCRHEFKDIYEICDELNNDIKEIDRLMELNNHLRFQLEECKKLTVKEFAKKLKEKYKVYDDRHICYRLIDELLKEYENGKSL